MPMTSYDYNIPTDFPNGIVDTSRLTGEIHAVGGIVPALDHIDTNANTCTIWFRDALSVAEKLLLDGAVAVHSGEPLPSDVVQKVQLYANASTPVPVSSDGRIAVRQTTSSTTGGKYRLRVFSFKSALPSSVHNKKPDVTDYGVVVMRCYDAGGAEVSGAGLLLAVKSVIDFEPSYGYEAIGGMLNIPPSIVGGITGNWFVSAIGVPDVPEAMGGSIDFINEVNLELCHTNRIDTDGRATTYMAPDATYHTNKIRFILRHPAGVEQPFQIYLETFR